MSVNNPTPRIVRRSVRRAGLTLLELALVVSILAILTALVVPGMTGQQEQTRSTVARASMATLREVISNRYLPEMGELPRPNASDATRASSDPLLPIPPQLHFLFVNSRQYVITANPPYVAFSDFDATTRIGWNGPYTMNSMATYPDPTAARFPNDANNGTLKWGDDYGFTSQYGLKGDFCVNDPWGSPIVIVVKNHAHGSLNLQTAYLASAGPNRKLDQATWTTNLDGTLNSGDDIALPIKTTNY